MFFGDSNILGHIVKLDEQPYVVIGVLAREAVFFDGAEFWTPLAADPIRSIGYYVNGIGRLKLGTFIEQVWTDLLRIHKGMTASGHKMNEITSSVLILLRDCYLGDYRIVGGGLLVAVAMI